MLRAIAGLIGALCLSICVADARAAEREGFGLTRGGQVLEAAIVDASSASAATVVLIGGLHGRDASSVAVARAVESFDALPRSERRFRLIAIDSANPEANTLAFPPSGVAYRENAEAHALWRWIGMQAPDLVLVVGRDEAGLAAELPTHAVAGVGRIPAQRADAGTSSLLEAIPSAIARSEARVEIDRRRARSPRQVAEELAQVYGRDFDQFTYLPGMALVGRVRLGHVADVERLAAPWINGSRDPLGKPSSLVLAGHLVFAALAEATGSATYIQALRKAADLGFTESGEMKESMPFHDEMSDSLFMATAILAKAGRLTGERRYFDMAARHVAFMQKLVLRSDGLYRHSPLTDAAWGRGNAFPALGLALTLAEFPKDHPGFAGLLNSWQQHMSALARFQDRGGLWRQVIDHRGAYAELSATAMIATSMLIGIRHGWLAADAFQPRVAAAWAAVISRIGPDGVLVDVCESTNKQRSLEDYLRRAAILDRDVRGGGMALIFATEMMR